MCISVIDLTARAPSILNMKNNYQLQGTLHQTPQTTPINYASPVTARLIYSSREIWIDNSHEMILASTNSEWPHYLYHIDPRPQ